MNLALALFWLKPVPQFNCYVAVIKDINGSNVCALWNRDDHEQKRNVFASINVNGGDACSAANMYQSLNQERYKAAHDHCKGRAKTKVVLLDVMLR